MALLVQGNHEEVVTISGSAYPLEGTLTLPKLSGPSPAILIIPGTGTSDRDGRNKKVPFLIYKELADFLTGLGFVTLRYDKRGIGGSKGDYYEAGLWDLVDDAVACVEYLKSRSEVDSTKIIILGHSEGSSLAPAVNSRLPVQGLILLSGACESLRESTKYQRDLAFSEMRNLKGFKGALFRKLNVAKKQERKVEKFMKRVMESKTPYFKILWVKINAKWMREHFQYNVENEMTNVTCPLLAITGSKDFQVPPEHAQKFAESARGASEWHIINNMTHILVSTEESAQILDALKLYRRVASNGLDLELLQKIESWLQTHFGVIKEEKQ